MFSLWQETEHLKKKSTHVEPLQIKIYNDKIDMEETVTLGNGFFVNEYYLQQLLKFK
jgi:hypothetical protein